GFIKKIKKFVTKALARVPSKSLKVAEVVKECLQAFPWLWAKSESYLMPYPPLTVMCCALPRDSLLRFAKNLQNHAAQDHNSQCFLIIALIAVVRYATITFINMEISADDALNEAYRQAPNVLPKLSEWIASSTAQADDIVVFINSMPWDMNVPHGLSS
ncbi:hypothetical protein C8F04DRAFT_1124061, partial [Mycena alexandri]